MPADEFALTGLLVVAYEVLHVPRLAKVEAYVTAEGFELVELLSDGFESAEDPDFFNKGFQILEDGKADVLLPLKLEAGGRLVP